MLDSLENSEDIKQINAILKTDFCVPVQTQ